MESERVRRRASRTPAALWQRWGQQARPPGCGAWARLVLAGLLWAWAWGTGQIAGWFLAAWLVPAEGWLLRTAWSFWREERASLRRAFLETVVSWALVMLLGGVSGFLLPPGPLLEIWLPALPWLAMAAWIGSWLLVGLLPWWPGGPTLMGVLWSGAGLSAFWLVGAFLARQQFLPAMLATLNGLAAWLGSWGLLLVAYGWIQVKPQRPRGWLTAAGSLAVGWLAMAGFWWAWWTLTPSLSPGTMSEPWPATQIQAVIPSTVTATPNPVEVIPGPPTPTWTPSPTLTPSPTPTPSPSPTWTPTPTVPTPTPPPPTPTPLLAFIQAPEPYNGAVVREAPHLDARVVITLLNGTGVLVLEPERIVQGVRWAHIRTLDGKYEGWVMQRLLVTATPPPRW